MFNKEAGKFAINHKLASLRILMEKYTEYANISKTRPEIPEKERIFPTLHPSLTEDFEMIITPHQYPHAVYSCEETDPFLTKSNENRILFPVIINGSQAFVTAPVKKATLGEIVDRFYYEQKDLNQADPTSYMSYRLSRKVALDKIAKDPNKNNSMLLQWPSLSTKKSTSNMLEYMSRINPTDVLSKAVNSLRAIAPYVVDETPDYITLKNKEDSVLFYPDLYSGNFHTENAGIVEQLHFYEDDAYIAKKFNGVMEPICCYCGKNNNLDIMRFYARDKKNLLNFIAFFYDQYYSVKEVLIRDDSAFILF